MTPYAITPNYVLTEINPGSVLAIAHNALTITSPALFHKSR